MRTNAFKPITNTHPYQPAVKAPGKLEPPY